MQHYSRKILKNFWKIRLTFLAVNSSKNQDLFRGKLVAISHPISETTTLSRWQQKVVKCLMFKRAWNGEKWSMLIRPNSCENKHRKLSSNFSSKIRGNCRCYQGGNAHFVIPKTSRIRGEIGKDNVIYKIHILHNIYNKKRAQKPKSELGTIWLINIIIIIIRKYLCTDYDKSLSLYILQKGIPCIWQCFLPLSDRPNPWLRAWGFGWTRRSWTARSWWAPLCTSRPLLRDWICHPKWSKSHGDNPHAASLTGSETVFSKLGHFGNQFIRYWA